MYFNLCICCEADCNVCFDNCYTNKLFPACQVDPNITDNKKLLQYVISVFILHAIEERCEHTEDSTSHTCKEEQLLIEKASNKTNEAPPPPPLCALL